MMDRFSVPSRSVTISATVPAGTGGTGLIDLGGAVLAGVLWDSAHDSGSYSLRGSVDGTTEVVVYDQTGTAAALTRQIGAITLLEYPYAGTVALRYVALKPVIAESVARSITLLCRVL